MSPTFSKNMKSYEKKKRTKIEESEQISSGKDCVLVYVISGVLQQFCIDCGFHNGKRSVDH